MWLKTPVVLLAMLMAPSAVMCRVCLAAAAHTILFWAIRLISTQSESFGEASV